MNVTVTKEENTVENKKSYPTSETVNLVFNNLVFRDDDPTQIKFNLYYRAYEFNGVYHIYTLIKDERFISFLDYLENTLSKKIPTKTPKKALLYFSSENLFCTLRFYTNSNQYKNSNYIDINFDPVFFSDSDSSHGLSMVKLSKDEELLEDIQEEEEEEVETQEQLEERIDAIVLKEYYRHLDKVCEEDRDYSTTAYSLHNKLFAICELFYDLLDLTMTDIKRDYFKRYASLK